MLSQWNDTLSKHIKVVVSSTPMKVDGWPNNVHRHSTTHIERSETSVATGTALVDLLLMSSNNCSYAIHASSTDQLHTESAELVDGIPPFLWLQQTRKPPAITI